MVLIVHHSVSPQVVEEIVSPLSTAYISNLEDYIQRNLPKLSLIVHSYIHWRYIYKIGSIPVICNPYSYALGENI
jgi:hypothetical protein